MTNDDHLGALLLQQLRLTLGGQAPGAFIATELIDALRSPLGPMPTDLILATCMYDIDACCHLSRQALFAILKGVRYGTSWLGLGAPMGTLHARAPTHLVFAVRFAAHVNFAAGLPRTIPAV